MNAKYSITLGIVFLLLFAVQVSSHKKKIYHPEFNDPAIWSTFDIGNAYAYPPGVGILSDAKNCLSCHINNGPWNDDHNLIIDILDKETKTSLRQPDGSFLIEVPRWEQKTILTVIGNQKSSDTPSPNKNAWLYIDSTTIGTSSLSKFAPNWNVNLPMSCRIVGDNLNSYPEANITSLPMTIQPLENAKNTEIQLQVMLTNGEAAKGKTDLMHGNYFERRVRLEVK